jgi:Transcription factor BRX N-terminal domain
VETLKRQGELKGAEMKKSEEKTQEALQLLAEEQSKSRAAKEVIKSLTAQVLFCFSLLFNNIVYFY